MTTILILLSLQGLLGALDTLWHHEISAHLPTRTSAAEELALHAAREAIYAVVFLSLAWLTWHGIWAMVLAGLLLTEIVITLKDFLVEDRTRRLAPTERVLHTVMAIGIGVILAAFAPILAGWAGRPTAFVLVQYGPLSWLMTLLGLGVLAWAVRDGLAVRSLGAGERPTAIETNGRTVLITGATGFIGTALVAHLQRLAYRVIVLARDPLQARAQFGASVVVLDQLGQLPAETRLHAVVNLAGASIAAGPWTRGRRRTLLDSRLQVTRGLLALIARLETRPGVLINASAVGFYGDRADQPLDEDAGPAPGFMSELCRTWEEEAVKAEAQGVRVCRLRLGLVFDWRGGILPTLALPAMFGMGAVLGTGRQWMAWVHLDDVLRVISAAIEDDRYQGPINVVGAELATQAQFTRALAFTLGRPQWLRVPALPIRLALGELSDLLLASQRVRPRRLAELGFEFRKGDLESALARPVRRTDGRLGRAVTS